MIEITSLDERREAIAFATPDKHKSAMGQFMTPSVIARFMAGMFNPLAGKKITLLDAGAGIGSLTAAFIERAASIDKAASIHCDAWEIDPLLHAPLAATLTACRELVAVDNGMFSSEIRSDDFITSFGDILSHGTSVATTHAILNPPYKKINSASEHRHALRRSGIETGNLYSAFVALALSSLAKGGELVAITPRSFCNGPYFRAFRELLLAQSAVAKIHVFESRNQAFKGDDVLQENVIFHLVKGAKQGSVIISTSTDATFQDVQEKSVPFSKIVMPGDGEKIFHLATEDESAETSAAMARYCHTLEDIGLGVSTGPVVDFRFREHLCNQTGVDHAPMVYAHHFENGHVLHPKPSAKKPNYIKVNDETRKWMMPAGCYVLVRRFSSKEERRRIVPALFSSDSVHGELVGFDNMTNAFHQSKKGLERNVAIGLAVYLGSTFADQWLRRFSGHTQVNAGDLRALRYPDIKTLAAWGKKLGASAFTQEKIDQLVGGV